MKKLYIKTKGWFIIKSIRVIVGIYSISSSIIGVLLWISDTDFITTPFIYSLEIAVWLTLFLLMVRMSKNNYYTFFKYSAILSIIFLFFISTMVYEQLVYDIDALDNPYFYIYIVVFTTIVIGLIISSKHRKESMIFSIDGH